MKSKYKTLIFDFDGTIADSFGVLLRVYSALSDELGLRSLKTSDVQKLRSMPPQQILRFIGVPFYRVPELLMKGRTKYREFIEDIDPIPGIPFVLMELQKKYPMHIMTSNDQDIVLSFFSSHKITCFEEVTSEKNIFGKDQSLKKMMKQLHLNPSEVLYIGDEVRDIEACKNIDVDICSVSWGLNTYEILQKHAPTYLLRKPQELLELLI